MSLSVSFADYREHMLVQTQQVTTASDQYWDNLFVGDTSLCHMSLQVALSCSCIHDHNLPTER